MVQGRTYANHDQIGTISTRSGSPVSDKISVPFTLRWTSHEDLFTDKNNLAAPLAVSWDLSVLRKEKDAEQ